MSEFKISGPAPVVIAPTYDRALAEATAAGFENWAWVNTIDFLADGIEPRLRPAFADLVDDLIRNHADELFDEAERIANGDG